MGLQGLVIIWSGTSNTVPDGWFVCDGTNGTPDLRNRFVVGAGSTYAFNATGGFADAIVPTHGHTVTAVNGGGNHDHAGWTRNSGYPSLPAGTTHVNVSFAGNTSNRPQLISLSGSSIANHTHTAASPSGSTGASASGANLPAYHSLFFIMRGGN